MAQKRNVDGSLSFRDAMRVLGRVAVDARKNWPQVIAAGKAWWHRPHPFTVLPLLVTPVLTAFALLGVYVWMPSHPFVQFAQFVHGGGDVRGVVLIPLIMYIISVAWLDLAVSKAEDKCKVVIAGRGHILTERMIADGYRTVEQTYRNVAYYSAVGLCFYLYWLYWCAWFIFFLCMVYRATLPFGQTMSILVISGIFGLVVGEVQRAIVRRFLESARRT